MNTPILRGSIALILFVALICCTASASETLFDSLDDVMNVTTGVERDFEAPEPGVTTTIAEIDLTPQTLLEGVVIGPSGRPVLDAEIHFKSGPVDGNGTFIGLQVHTVRTGRGGAYRFLAEHDQYNVTVFHKTHGVAVVLNLSPSEFEGKPLNFELAPVMPPLPHSVNGVTRTT